jgi:hypothetical protein
MNTFGQTLFGGGRFVRWTLTPFVLIFAVVMPLAIEDWTLARVGLMAGLELMCLTLLAGFWLPARVGHWAFRGLAVMVFLAYTAYFVHEFFFTGRPFTISGSRGGASPFNALLGLLIIGVPSLMYAVLGRFTPRPAVSPEELEAERQAYEERILRPDWEFYERHLQRSAPEALRKLYADRALVTAGNLDYSDRHRIGTFEALDEERLLDTREQLGFDVVAFATSDCGDPIYLRPGPSEADTVFITYHDGGDTEVFAESVEAMLERLRLKLTPEHRHQA